MVTKGWNSLQLNHFLVIDVKSNREEITNRGGCSYSEMINVFWMEMVGVNDTIYFKDEQSMGICKIGSTLDFGIISLIHRFGVPPSY